MEQSRAFHRQELFSDYMCRLISPAGLGKLEKAVGNHPIGLLSIQITEFFTRVAVFGEDLGFQLLKTLKDEVLIHFALFFPSASMIALENGKLNDLMIWFECTEDGISRLADSTRKFRLHLHQTFNHRIADRVDAPMDIRIGHAWIRKNPSEGFYRTLFKALCDVQRIARLPEDTRRSDLHGEFIALLEGPSLKTAYQPVIDFHSGRILGWEAFTRGPAGSVFEKPSILFRYAEEVGQIPALERKCGKNAVTRIGPIAPDQNLFMNIRLQSLTNPEFTPNAMLKMVRGAGLHPENVILEFSENDGIRDLELLIKNLDHYRKEGFKVAIDDAGAGRSSLRAISCIRPDYIKIDTSLVRSVDASPIQRVLVESFVTLSRKIGFGIIAEGIETQTELHALIFMGVRFGQGSHIAGPAFPKPSLCIMTPPRPSFRDTLKPEVECTTPIRRLIRPAATTTPFRTVREVRETLSDQSPMSSIVVLEDRRPVGLLMNYNLDRKLGTPYGVSLHYDRKISRLMDTAPLLAEITEPVEEVAKKAMNREGGKLYDDIIVTESGIFAGTVSVQKMLDHLAEVQVQIAMGANPLTGLPGNVVIEQEIGRRAAGKTASSLIYIDLDNFKVYNDVYGFDRGDRLILFTARLLKEAVSVAGASGDFIGHVGGDDFIIIAEHRNSEGIARMITERFEAKAPDFYTEEDQAKGFIIGTGRDGIEKEFPFVSVSVGIVDCAFEGDITMDALSHRVAAVKKYAKSIPGNAYVKDRRGPL